MFVAIDPTTRQIIRTSSMDFTDAEFEVVEVADEAIRGALNEPGTKLLAEDGTVTVTPPPPPPGPSRAELQRVQDAATLLNSPAVRDTKEHRDAFARLIGTRPVSIPLAQDATAQDIQPL